MRPLPEDWLPDEGLWFNLSSLYGRTVDLTLSLRRFKNFYCEGQTSRNWDAKFENWVINDYERKGGDSGTDDLGIPHNQRKREVEPAKPGDPNYFNPFDQQ
jgi:hypothetical protein